MQPPPLDIHAQSIVGYLLYWMERGATPDEAYERARLQKRFGDQPVTTFQQALRIAVDAQQDLAALNRLAPGRQIVPALTGLYGTGATFGLRIEYHYVDQTGTEQVGSLVVNVTGGTTLQQVQDWAARTVMQGWVTQGGNSPPSAISPPTIEIFQVVPYAYQGNYQTLG